MEKTKVAHERPQCTRYRGRLPARPRRPRFLRTGYLRNAASFLSFTGLYAAVNVVLFGVRVWQYADRALLEQMARGTGFCLNFDCAMVLMLVLRRMLTWLRSHRVGQLLPLEHHIYLHKMAGWSVFILSSAHTFFHMANFVNMSHRSGVTVQDYLFDTSMGIGWFAGSANITGIVLLVILTVMVICSHRAVRKSGYFEIFYWTHLLSVPICVLLILHSPNFWKWFLVPGALFAIEVACRISRVCSNRGRSIITSATLLPSEVVRLTVSRPPDFLFHPGDFCYVKIPTVAKYEWHPFTISSSPENTDQMTFHIRVVGEWTRSLHENVLDACLKAALFNQIALMSATVAAPPSAQVAPPSAQVALPAPHRLAGAMATLPVHLRRLEWLRLRVNSTSSSSTSSTRGIIGADQESDCETPHGRDNAGFQSDADEPTALTMVPMTAPAASSAVLTASSAVLTVSSAVLPTTSSAVLPTASSPALPTASSPVLPTVSSPALPTTPSPALPTTTSPALPTASSPVFPTASSAVLPAETSSVPPTASSTVVPAASTNWTDLSQDTDDQRGSEDTSNISVANAGIPCGDLVDATTQRQDCVEAAETTEQEQGRVDTVTRQRDRSGATQRRQQQQDRVGAVVQHQDRIEAAVQQQDRVGAVVQQQDRVGAVVQEQDSTGMTAQDYDESGAAVWEQGHAEVTSPPPREPGTGTGRAGSMKRKHKRSLQHGSADRLEWKILLDGPYGAPSTSIFHAQHAVLIGGGIGVTPFASVLHCIVDRYNAAHRPCPHCRVPTCLEMPSTMLKLKKVDFVWVNRDMRSFEWFLELLHELRESQQRNGSQLDSFLTMQLYKTSSMPIVGRVPLRNEVKQGRPDWDKVFSQIRHRRCGKVTVFYCGPPTLGNVIREKAAKYGFGFVKEMF